jgi:hypothetical protein
VAEEVFSAVKTQAKETGLSINEDKTKMIIQTRNHSGSSNPYK